LLFRYNGEDLDEDTEAQVLDSKKKNTVLISDAEEVHRLEQCLNADQRDAFVRLIRNVEHRWRHHPPLSPNKECPEPCEDCRAIKMIIQGLGGTGKSFLIDVLRNWVQLLDPEQNEAQGYQVAVVAPTGIAAYNISGQTAHSVFKLPIQKGNQLQSFFTEDDVGRKELREKWKHVKLVIIDEFSMLSNVQLNHISRRLNFCLLENDDSAQTFGGLPVVLLGDFLQLAPVNAAFIFESMNADTMKSNFGSIARDPRIWDDFEYRELQINQRQKEDADFADMLQKIRCGIQTEEMLVQLAGQCVGNVYQRSTADVEKNDRARYDELVRAVAEKSEVEKSQPKKKKLSLEVPGLQRKCLEESLFRLDSVRCDLPVKEREDILRRASNVGDENQMIEHSVQFAMDVDRALEKEGKNHRLVALFGVNRLVDSYNALRVKLQEIKMVDPEKLRAIDSTERFCGVQVLKKGKARLKKCSVGAKMKTSRTAGLAYELQLGIGARVMLRRNINVPGGLVNGATGSVVSFSPPTGRIDFINVKFDAEETGEQAIPRVSADFELTKNVIVTRTQFPICLSYAMTVHKCQGLTLNYVLLDMDSLFEAGMAYVGMSRVKTLKGLFLTSWSPRKIYCARRPAEEYNRLRESIGMDRVQFAAYAGMEALQKDFSTTMRHFITQATRDQVASKSPLNKEKGKKKKPSRKAAAAIFARSVSADKSTNCAGKPGQKGEAGDSKIAAGEAGPPFCMDFPNFDNACYGNSAVQLLLHLHDFLPCLLGYGGVEGDPSEEHRVAVTMRMVAEAYVAQSKDQALHGNLIRILRNEVGQQFQNDKEQDAVEFLRELLQRLSDSTVSCDSLGYEVIQQEVCCSGTCAPRLIEDSRQRRHVPFSMAGVAAESFYDRAVKALNEKRNCPHVCEQELDDGSVCGQAVERRDRLSFLPETEYFIAEMPVQTSILDEQTGVATNRWLESRRTIDFKADDVKIPAYLTDDQDDGYGDRSFRCIGALEYVKSRSHWLCWLRRGGKWYQLDDQGKMKDRSFIRNLVTKTSGIAALLLERVGMLLCCYYSGITIVNVSFAVAKRRPVRRRKDRVPIPVDISLLESTSDQLVGMYVFIKFQ
jgi:hypothetical protein